MRTTNFKIRSDELYWTRVQVFEAVHKTLERHFEGQEDSASGSGGEKADLLKIQALIKNQLWQDMNYTKSDL